MSEEMKKTGEKPDLDLAWDNCQTWMESGEPITVKVDGVVKGGVVAYVEGIRGFIPASKLLPAMWRTWRTISARRSRYR